MRRLDINPVYIYVFGRHFYPKRLTLHFKIHIYILISSGFPWESNPWPWCCKR